MKLKGPWSRTEVEDHLARAVVPLRLSTAGASGWPMVVSVWYLWRDGALWCASGRSAAIVRALEAEPRCGFEIAGDTPPYFGVRGRGRAEILPDGGPLLRELYRRYGGDEDHAFGRWLLGRDAEEARIRIAPERLMSWDYRVRMAGAFG